MRRVLVSVVLMGMGGMAVFAFTVPAVEAGGGGGHGGCAQPREGADEPIVIKDNCFSPAVLYVEPGAEVQWQQKDAAPHNVTSFDGDVVGGDGELEAGDTVSRTFDAPGVFAFYCSIHPSMVGVVIVGDTASPAFGASHSAQSQEAGEAPGAPLSKGTLDSGKGNSDIGAGWGEVAVGLGVFGGLLVGLVAVGGGLRLHRR